MWLKRTEIYDDDPKRCAQPRTHMEEKAQEGYSAEPADAEDNKTKLCLEKENDVMLTDCFLSFFFFLNKENGHQNESEKT